MFFEPERKNSRKSTPLYLQSLANAQQNEKFTQTFLRGFSLNHTAKQHKRFYGVLSVVVIPGNAVKL
jgi:hypothetical protein